VITIAPPEDIYDQDLLDRKESDDDLPNESQSSIFTTGRTSSYGGPNQFDFLDDEGLNKSPIKPGGNTMAEKIKRH
jgi:hypothetical protein